VATETANVQIAASGDMLADPDDQSEELMFTEQVRSEHSYASHLPALTTYANRCRMLVRPNINPTEISEH